MIKKSPKQFMTPAKTRYHAELLGNRVRKRYDHLRKRFARWKIDCFRLYDWDIPEVRAVVDWYKGHLVVAEYIRRQSGPDWLPAMAEACAGTLGVSTDKIHIKLRQTKTGEGGSRYKRLAVVGEEFTVTERDLQFWVNLNDFLDTGLFSDHRETRVMVKAMAKGKKFLNLYAYTGTFTCAAAAGGAVSTVAVDRSLTYQRWTQRNLELNNLWGSQHILVQSDVDKFLRQAEVKKEKFTLAFVDPPSFFQDRRTGASFDINRDHPTLLRNVLKLMEPGSTLLFSTNHQRFAPRLEGLAVDRILELTPKTIPEDYRNKKIHRCWKMTAK